MFKLMPLLLIAVGVAAFAYLWRLGETGRAAEAWPQAVGEVTGSRVDTRLRPGGGDASRQEQYKAEIRYTYRYGGRDYQGATVAFPDPGYGQSLTQAEARAARYPAGTQVRVYVNPANPAQACLEAGRHWTVWAGLALCLAFVGAGVGLLTGIL
ncbi:DUF3592 domain-containing protein [Crenobacter caeni]|uniref:DUF3592 domain-containing protein n=1 Tax=Crenobacter caeni TaxID=2705474 RepID=A0A6B2KP55_9NEIS|nr:DUF3592 domain-containing protein [Crenobacter caeni]